MSVSPAPRWDCSVGQTPVGAVGEDADAQAGPGRRPGKQLHERPAKVFQNQDACGESGSGAPSPPLSTPNAPPPPSQSGCLLPTAKLKARPWKAEDPPLPLTPPSSSSRKPRRPVRGAGGLEAPGARRLALGRWRGPSPRGPRADDRRRRGPSFRECLADVSLLGKRRPEIVPAAWDTAAPPRPPGRGRPAPQGQKLRTPRQPGPRRRRRVTAVKPPTPSGRADRAPTCTRAEGRARASRDNDQGAQLGPKGPPGLCEDPGGASPRPGCPSAHRLPRVRLPPARGSCCPVGGRGLPALPALPPGACSRASRSGPHRVPGHPAPPCLARRQTHRPRVRVRPGGGRGGDGGTRGAAAGSAETALPSGGLRVRRAPPTSRGPRPRAASPAHEPRAPPTAAGAGQVPTVRGAGGRRGCGDFRPSGLWGAAWDCGGGRTEELGWGRWRRRWRRRRSAQRRLWTVSKTPALL
ncbi:collagen alpha-1(I) chain-like [Lontra canadensis]|uniref:collagen alpha-1(I) chain-like n=1 Tax=Lontra canadensis TaxID=76717 RepID=UPI0013F30EAE|nr:collagen alpha-1(I) chain-like [Lontra canadensis]